MNGARSLFVVIVLGAAALRLPAIGAPPFSPSEATHAWTAWLAAGGWHATSPSSDPPVGTSPLLLTLQTLLFGLVGASDVAARLPSALAGLALPALAWTAWRKEGEKATATATATATALTAASLLAIDPILVEASRHADGAILSALLAGTVASCLLRLRAETGDSSTGSRRRWHLVAAAGLGLLLVSGPHAFSLAFPLALACLFLRRRTTSDGAGNPPFSTLAGTFTAAAFLGATGLGASWGFAGGVSLSLTHWIDAFSRPSPFVAASHALATLVRADPVLLALAAAGIGSMASRKRTRATGAALACLVAVSFVVAIFRGGGRAELLAPTLTMIVPAAAGGDFLARRLRGGLTGRELGFLGLLVAGTVGAAFHVFYAARDLRIGALLLVAPLGLAVVGRWLGSPLRLVEAARTVAVLLLVVCALWTIRSAAPFRDPTLPARATVGAARLASDVERLSAERTGSRYALPIRISASRIDPLLAWHLREMGDLEWVEGPPGGIGEANPEALVILLLEDDRAVDDALPGGSGRRYELHEGSAVLWVNHGS